MEALALVLTSVASLLSGGLLTFLIQWVRERNRTRERQEQAEMEHSLRFAGLLDERIEKHISRVETDNERMRQRIERLEQDVRSLMDKLAEKDNAIERLEQDLVTVTRQRDKLQEEVDKLLEGAVAAPDVGKKHKRD